VATRDFCARVIPSPLRVRPGRWLLYKAGRIQFVAVVLYRPDVKRQLATLEAATVRAVELAREIIKRQAYRPPDVDTLTCTVEVTLFDLRPFRDVAWIQEDGAKVWIVEAERPLPFGWAWQR
jgi:hypothetical protein